MDVELMAAVLIVSLTILIPINGAMLLGMIYERRKMRRLLMGLWKLHNGRK